MAEPRSREMWCDTGCPYYPEPPRLWKVEEHREEWEALRRKAQEDAERIARRLVDEFGARRVWIYGSAAGTWVFHPWSDLDMAVEGVEGLGTGDLQDRAQPMTSFKLDLRKREDYREDDWERFIPRPRLLAEGGA